VTRATYGNQNPMLADIWHSGANDNAIDRTVEAFWPWHSDNGPRQLQPLADAQLALAVAFTGGFPDEVFERAPVEWSTPPAKPRPLPVRRPW
jgi:hypothetical protein